MCTTERAFFVKHEALEAGARHECPTPERNALHERRFTRRVAGLRP